MKTFDLCPIDGRKSFYGKAKVFQREDGASVLKSYQTDVCMIDKNGVFHRFWSGESATTMRHVNSFLACYGIAGGGVSWWRKQPVEHFNRTQFFIEKAV